MKKVFEQTVFFATDLHGLDRCFKKFLTAASFYDASLLILGDLVGKEIVLIRRRSHSTFEAEWRKEIVTLETEAELKGF